MKEWMDAAVERWVDAAWSARSGEMEDDLRVAEVAALIGIGKALTRIADALNDKEE